MNSPRHKNGPGRDENSSLTVQQGVLMAAVFLLCAATIQAAQPGWWTAPGGPVNSSHPAQDYAVVNQGQLKQFTQKAVLYLDTNLPDGAGPTLDGMVAGWSNSYATNGYTSTNPAPGDLRVVNHGQLKYIASLVYGQLSAEGYTGLYPSWLVPNTNAEYKVANQAQLKTVFNFDLSVAPPAVTNLVATETLPGEIDLTWALPANNNSTSQVVQISTNNGATWTTLATLDPTATYYAASGLSGLTHYITQVVSGNLIGATLSSTTPPAPPIPAIPPTPGGLIGAVDMSGTMNLSWTAVTGDGVVTYKVDRETIATGVWSNLTPALSGTTYQDGTHGAGGYRYRVSAAASSTTGTSTLSATSGAYPPPRYALIDLGKDMAPIKITDTGYILMAGSDPGESAAQVAIDAAFDTPDFPLSTLHVGPSYFRWHNGTPTELEPHISIASDFRRYYAAPPPYDVGSITTANDIGEDGTVAGSMEYYQYMANPSGTGPLTTDHVQEAKWAPTSSTPSVSAALPDLNIDYTDGPVMGSIDTIVAISGSAAWSSQTLDTQLAHSELYATALYRAGVEVGSTTFTNLDGSTPLDGTGHYTINFAPGVDLYGLNQADQALLRLINYTFSVGPETYTPISDGYIFSSGGSLSGTTLPFSPYGLSNPATLSSGAVTYVIGTQTTTSGTISTSSPVWWDGSVHTITDGWPSAINAATISGTSVIQPAAQMVGQNNAGSVIWQMDPTGTFGPAQSLNDLLPDQSPYSAVGVGGSSVNVNGAIVGTATYTPTGTTDPIAAGSHGVLLLPVIFTVTRPNAPASEVAADPSVTTTPTNTIPRDEIVNVKLKIPPLANQDLTVTLDVSPDAMKTQTLATPNDSRGDVQMFDFGTIGTTGTITANATQVILKATDNGEETFAAVFNKEGTLNIKISFPVGTATVTAQSQQLTITKQIRKYAKLSGSTYDFNQYDQAFVDAASTWQAFYLHAIDDVDRLKAIGMTESEIGRLPTAPVDRPFDIMTIGNPGDNVLNTFHNVPPYDKLAPAGQGLREVVPASNTTRLLSYPAANCTTAADAILWGTCWLYQKDSTIATNPSPPPTYIPGTWRTWDDATTRYNGGGVTNYLERVDRAFLEGKHPTDSVTIWPLETDGKARP